MSENRVDYIVRTNEDWRDSIILQVGDPLTAIDLTGDHFRAQVRTDVDALATILDADTAENDLIEIADAENGVISWNVPVETLSTFTPGTYYYDIVRTAADGQIDTFVTGTIVLERGVTRE